MKPDLRGRRAIVTGGVRRLGRAFALALAQSGADIVATTREPGIEADAMSAELAAIGVRGKVVACDVRQPESVRDAIATAADFLGGIDLLVNNAGMFESVALEALTPEQWDSAYQTNTRGPFLTAQAALPHLRKGIEGGRIINIGSLGGLRPWTTHGHYCASKAALHMLTQTMAKAWAPDVSVNCIAPGMIQLAGEPQRMAAKTPMGCDGTPDDVVAALLFFAGAPRFITGQVLAVDGGLSLA